MGACNGHAGRVEAKLDVSFHVVNEASPYFLFKRHELNLNSRKPNCGFIARLHSPLAYLNR
jgi:hypothetical protein